MAAKRPHLFEPLDPPNPHAPGVEVVVGGRRETPQFIAESYTHAAHTLFDQWITHSDDDDAGLLVLPILQMYRHAIELLLKAKCLAIRQLILDIQEAGFETGEPDPELDNKLGNCHSIQRLINIMRELFKALDETKLESTALPEDVGRTLDSLHELDSQGTAFRYATKRPARDSSGQWVPERPEEITIDLESTAGRLMDAVDTLDAGIGGYLDMYEGWLRDVRDDAL